MTAFWQCCACVCMLFTQVDDTSQVLKRNKSKILYYNWLVFISWTIPLCEKYKRPMWKRGNFKFSCQNIKCRKKKQFLLDSIPFCYSKGFSLSVLCARCGLFSKSDWHENVSILADCFGPNYQRYIYYFVHRDSTKLHCGYI